MTRRRGENSLRRSKALLSLSQAGVSEAPGCLRERPGADSRDLDLRPASACTPGAMQSSPPFAVSCLSLLASSSSYNP